MLGKRKRDVVVVTRQIRQEDSDIQSLSPSADEKQDILRKVFEARFGPVEALVKPIARSPEEPSHLSLAEGNDDEWEGLSDQVDNAASDEHPSAEVVEHTTSWNSAKDMLDKPARKAFMVCFILLYSYFIQADLYLPPVSMHRKEKQKAKTKRKTSRGDTMI